MKSKAFKTGLAIFIFVLIFALFSGATIPIYRNITKAMEKFEDKYLLQLEETTGMRVRYESLSPSLLYGVKLKNIQIYDGISDNVLLDIKKASLGYSLKKLIHMDLENAFTSLTINDVYFNYNEKDFPLITFRMRKLLNQNTGPQESVEITDALIRQIKEMLFIIPFGVQIRNINFSMDAMESLGINGNIRLERTEIRKEANGKALSAIVRGYIAAALEPLQGKKAGLTFELNCKILEKIEDSSVIITLGDYAQADYSVKRMEFLLRYADNVASVNSIQQVIPYSVGITFDIKNHLLNAEVATELLNPLDMVRIPPLPQEVKMVAGTTVTLYANAALDLEKQDINWDARGTVSLSKRILNNSQWFNFDLNGNDKEVYINSLEAIGWILGATASGYFNIQELAPDFVMEVDHFRIPGGNDNALSMDIYVDSYDSLYNLFIPQLYLGERFFTAIQAEVDISKSSAIDFTLSLNDYSHVEYGSPGEITVDGSFIMGKKNVLEVMADIDNLFLDSILDTVSFFTDEDISTTMKDLSSTFNSFIMSTEVYFSTDMESVTFNLPYSIVANTQADRQVLLLSVDGNEQSVSVSQLDLVYDSITVQATANADMFLEDQQVVFGTSFNINSIPYHLEGNFYDGEWINITGDYGLDALVNIGNTIKGNLSFSQLPLVYEDFFFYFNLRTAFSYEMKTGSFFDNPLTVNIEEFGFEEASGSISFNPKVNFMGVLDNSGFVIQALSYADNTSTMEGNGYAMWNMNNGAFQNLNVNFFIKNPIAPENIRIEGSVTNTLAENSALTLENILKYSIDMQVEINGLDMGRFIEFQDPEDTINTVISATGTLENPSVLVNVRKAGINLNGMPIFVSGNVNLQIISDDEWNVDVMDINVNCADMMDVQNLSGSLELTSFEGKLQGTLFAAAADQFVKAPFEVGIHNLQPPDKKAFIPETFLVDINSNMETSFLEEKIPVHVEMIRYPGTFVFSTNDTFKVNGYAMDDGSLGVNIDPSMPLHFNLTGKFVGRSMDVTIKNFYCDIPEFAQYINSDLLSIYKGVFKGEVRMSGLQKDPSIQGGFALTDLDFNMPSLIPDHFTCRGLYINMNQDGIEIPLTSVKVRDTALELKAGMQLNCWSIENLRMDVATSGDKGIPLDVKIPLVRAKGKLGLSASVTMDSNALDVDAKVILNNTDVTLLDLSSGFDISKYTGAAEKKDNSKKNNSPFDVRVKAQLIIGEKVQFLVNPVLRGLLAQNSPLTFTMDTSTESWAINGTVALKGGEVSYLSRNFYIKEGSITLNETQDSIDPVVSFRAEAREHDTDGSPVTIILTALNQRISCLKPSLFSRPAKSEKEILDLLGSVFTGDSEDVKSFLVSGVDYGVQVTVLRKVENALRDLCNFDIFSVRSSVLQNAIKQGLNMNSANTSKNNSTSNYFDNSTVYIGKYFGEFIYADATLHWSYDDALTGNYDLNKGILFNAQSWAQGFVFQPEIGLEFESPFANIRWSMAPDWGNLQNTLVSSTSITLSWRLTF